MMRIIILHEDDDDDDVLNGLSWDAAREDDETMNIQC